MISAGDMNSSRNFSAFTLTHKQIGTFVMPNRWERFLRRGVGVALRVSAVLVSPINASTLTPIVHYRHNVKVIRRETRGGVDYDTVAFSSPTSDSKSADYAFVFEDEIKPLPDVTRVAWIVEAVITSTDTAANAQTWDSSIRWTTAHIQLIGVGTLDYEFATMASGRPSMTDAIPVRDDLSALQKFRRSPLIELPGTRIQSRGLAVYERKFEKILDVDHVIPVGVTWVPLLLPNPIGSNDGKIIYRHAFTSTDGGQIKLLCNGIELHQGAILGPSEGEHILDRGYWFPSGTGSGLQCEIEIKNIGTTPVRLKGRHMVRRYSPALTPSGYGVDRGRRNVVASNKAFIAGIVGSPDTFIPFVGKVFSMYEADVFYLRIKLNSRWIEPEIHLGTLTRFSRLRSDADIHFGMFTSRQPMWHQGKTTAGAPSDIKFWQRIRLVPYRVAGPTTALSLIGSMRSAAGDTSVKVTNGTGIKKGMIVKIGQEEMLVNSRSGNTITVANRSDPTWAHAAHAVVTSWTEHTQLCGGVVFHPIRNALSITNAQVRLEEAGHLRY